MSRRPPPFVELQVAGLDGEGRGVGYVEGRRIRAKNVLPGEHMRVRPLGGQPCIGFRETYSIRVVPLNACLGC